MGCKGLKAWVRSLTLVFNKLTKTHDFLKVMELINDNYSKSNNVNVILNCSTPTTNNDDRQVIWVLVLVH